MLTFLIVASVRLLEITFDEWVEFEEEVATTGIDAAFTTNPVWLIAVWPSTSGPKTVAEVEEEDDEDNEMFEPERNCPCWLVMGCGALAL